MLSDHIAQYLIEQGFATAHNVDVFSEAMPLDKYGVSVYSVGGETALSRTKSSLLFDIEARHETDSRVARDKLEKIAQHLRNAKPCELPIIPGVSHRQYTSCQFYNIGNVQFLGDDSEGKSIFKITASIVYIKK